MDALIFLAIIGWVISTLGKLSKRQDADRRPAHRGPGGARFPQPGADGQAQAPARPVDARPQQRPDSLDTPARQTGTVTFADDDGPEDWRAATWERHGAEADATEAHTPPEARAASIPGLDLALDGESVVKGVIYAEILGRRTAGRRI